MRTFPHASYVSLGRETVAANSKRSFEISRSRPEEGKALRHFRRLMAGIGATGSRFILTLPGLPGRQAAFPRPSGGMAEMFVLVIAAEHDTLRASFGRQKPKF